MISKFDDGPSFGYLLGTELTHIDLNTIVNSTMSQQQDKI